MGVGRRYPPCVPDKDQSPTATGGSPLAWWVRDNHGGSTLAQWPNPALGVWLLALVLGRTDVLGPPRAATLATVGSAALLVWALDEALRGASPIRRLIGAGVLVAQVVRLFA